MLIWHPRQGKVAKSAVIWLFQVIYDNPEGHRFLYQKQNAWRRPGVRDTRFLYAATFADL